MGRMDLTYCNSGQVHHSHHVCSVCTGCTLLYKHLKCFHILHQYHRLICSTGNCKICLKSTDSWQILQFTWHRTGPVCEVICRLISANIQPVWTAEQSTFYCKEYLHSESLFALLQRLCSSPHQQMQETGR